MNEKIKNIIMSIAGEMPDKKTRDSVAEMLSESVFSGMPVTDITTPEEVDRLILTYAIEVPGGQQKIIIIETANGILDKDNINIKTQ